MVHHSVELRAVAFYAVLHAVIEPGFGDFHASRLMEQICRCLERCQQWAVILDYDFLLHRDRSTRTDQTNLIPAG